MPNHDRLFKELLRVFFLEFIDLFWPDVAKAIDANSVEFLQQEIFTDVTVGERHEADLLASARVAGVGPMVFHIEAQGTAQLDFPERMFSYFSRIHLSHRLPVFSVAVFSYDSPLEAAPDSYGIEVLRQTRLQFRYATVQLNRLAWRDFAGSRNPVACALMAKMRMKPEERKLVKLECLRSMLALGLDPARQQLIAGFVGTYLRLTPDEEEWVVKQLDISDIDQGLFWTYWHEKGHAQGVAEGRAEGGSTVVEGILRLRLGELPQAVTERIRSLSIAQLVALGESASRMQTAANLDEWLRRNSA